jgi:lipopolysaccharide export system ATP-binding protein
MSLKQMLSGFGLTYDFHESGAKNQCTTFLSFTIKPTEIVGLNDCDVKQQKILFSLISGAFMPTSGSLFIDNIDITKMEISGRAAHGIAVVPEHFGLLNHMSVMENYKLAYTLGKKGESFKSIIKICYNFFPISSLEKQKFITLSGGEKRMVAICCGILRSPKYILFDNPTTGLSHEMKGKFLELVNYLSGKGYGVVIFDADHTVIEKACNKMIRL